MMRRRLVIVYPHGFCSGVARAVVGDQEIILRAGSGYRIPANVPHYLEVLEDVLVLDCFSPQREDLPATVP